MPQQVADAIVRLEERNIQADEMFAAAQAERVRLHEEQVRLHGEQVRLQVEQARLQGEQIRLQGSVADALHRIAHSLDRLADRFQGPSRRGDAWDAPSVSPQQLLAAWRPKNLVVTDDVHAVAAYLAPALVRGEARFRAEAVAERTGLTVERVVDCVRMLLKRGCMRQRGCSGDGTPVYVLP
jgi:site-specific recombinase